MGGSGGDNDGGGATATAAAGGGARRVHYSNQGMFNGRTRRTVNLGSKKSASTSDVLKKAETQRQWRDKLRRETTAAVKIQTKWRANKELEHARHDFTISLLERSVTNLISAEELAIALPALSTLENDQKVELIQRFLASPLAHEYSVLLVQRLPYLWGVKTRDHTGLHALAVRVLQCQNPPNIPVPLLVRLIESTPESEIIDWLAAKEPRKFLAALIERGSAELVKNLSPAALVSLCTGSEIASSDFTRPDAPQNFVILSELLAKAIPLIPDSWPLVTSIIVALHEHRITNRLLQYNQQLCNQELVVRCLNKSTGLLAQYTLALLSLFPRAKPTILLQLSLATSPSPLTSFWEAFKHAFSSESQDIMLHACTEMYSYWLLVSTDAELFRNTSLGLNLETAKELTTIVRDRCFDILWQNTHKKVRAPASVSSLLKLLRQIYTRDTRMNIFPKGFWHMDVIPQNQFLQQIEGSNSLYGLGVGQDESESDDPSDSDSDSDDDDDDYTVRGNSKTMELHGEDPSHRLRDHKVILRGSPALRILDYAPFFVPFETRAALFYKYVEKDRAAQPSAPYPRHQFDIRRETLIEDAQHVFASLGSRVKTDLQIRLFSNGSPEAGVDGGGLTRELLTAICSQEFGSGHRDSTSHSLQAMPPAFIETLNHTVAPNPVFGESPHLMVSDVRKHYLFLGQVIGKCLYENLLVNVEFAPFFLAKWNKPSANSTSTSNNTSASVHNSSTSASVSPSSISANSASSNHAHNNFKSSFDDLSLLDDELYRNISKLHNIHGPELDALGLDFTIVNSQRQVVELRPNGASIPVNDSNKLEFMRDLANYKLNVSLRPQTMWFVLGLSQVIRLEWLNMFNPQELNKLISGESQDFDVEDLKRNTEILGFEDDSPTIKNLWTLLREFEPHQRASFLQFITSVPKAPLLGFSRLEPRLGIRCAGHDDGRLPTSSTCVNLLKLPEYSSMKILRKKLLYSIESKAGFELS